MSLLNKPANVETGVTAPVVGEEKKGNSHSEYQKKQRELSTKYGKLVREYVEKQSNVPADVLEAAKWLGRDRKEGASFVKKDWLAELFGADAKVGSVLNPLDAFNKFGFGFREINDKLKKIEAANSNFKYSFDPKTKQYKITVL